MPFAAIALAGVLAALPAESTQTFSWKWSDGSTGRERVFSQVEYPAAGMLPTLVVRADPAEPSRTVRLEYRAKGSWTIESQVGTNKRGVARLALNPICGTTWCSGTYRYRLLIAGRATDFVIRYEPRP